MNNTTIGRTALTAIATLLIAACSTTPPGPALGDSGFQGTSDSAQCASADPSGSGGANTTDATGAQVIAAVKAAECVTKVPDSVAASLTQTEKAEPKNPFQCYEVDNPVRAGLYGQCAFGDRNGTRLMVIYGDSRAQMWAATLEGVAAKYGWKLRVFSLGGCPIPDLQFFSQQTHAPNQNCDKYHDIAPTAIRALHPDLVITTSLAWLGIHLADGTNPTATQWQEGLGSMFSKVSQPGTRLAMIGSIPDATVLNPTCLAAHLKAVQKCAVAVHSAAPNGLDAEQAAATAAGALYVPAMPWVCGDRCEPFIAGIRVFNEDKHFTQSYAVYLTGALGEALQPVLG
jgi:hypothetical protein